MRATLRCFRFSVLLVLLFTLAHADDKNAQKPQPTNNTPVADNSPVPKFGERTPRYEIRPGDVFDLQFEFSPEYNQTVTVQPDGYVMLKGIGDTYVSGKTVPELTESLKGAYGKFLAQPVINVVLKDFEKPYFTANGSVQKPGKYELRADTTVTEAIALAGGFNDNAKHSQVVLFRRVSQEWVEAKVIDVKSMLNKRDLREDVHLQPGDMIYVPQNKISKIKKWIPYTAFNMGAGAF